MTQFKIANGCNKHLFFFLNCLFAISWATPADMEVPRLGGSHWSCSCQPTPEPQQRGIWAASAPYTTAHGNAGLLTNWARAGIEPETSWFLVGFTNHCATTGTPPIIFSNHSTMKLEIIYNWKSSKITNMWKLNNMLLNNILIPEEIKEEIKNT